MFVLRLGFLSVFLAPPLVSGFTTAAALSIVARYAKEVGHATT